VQSARTREETLSLRCDDEEALTQFGSSACGRGERAKASRTAARWGGAPRALRKVARWFGGSVVRWFGSSRVSAILETPVPFIRFGLNLLLAVAVACSLASSWPAGPAFDALAQAPQQNRSPPFGPGQWGPVDPVYIQMANETGGQPFFMNPLEVADSVHIIRETSHSNSEMVLWASSTTPNEAREFAVPIDSTIRRLTFSASFDVKGGDLTILGPKGMASGRDDRTEDTISSCSRVVTIEAPASGTWQARLSAPGRFWLVVHARSELSLLSAEFVRLGGHPG